MSYVLFSDIHAHRWTLFSRPTSEGVNGRLQIIIDELKRGAALAVKRDAKAVVIAGDIMHVRGSIDPHVLNPLEDCFQEILDMGLDIEAIPGNHDLADKETTKLGNAIKTFGKLRGVNGEVFRVRGEASGMNLSTNAGGHDIVFIPWFSKTDDLLQAIEAQTKHCFAAETDLIIHAGIDGVIPGLPGHGLTADMLAAFGFRNVFAGHYHNHKRFDGNVWSIGATTHQTWSDVGSKAGFLFIDDTGAVEYHASRAPRFVDVTGYTEEDMALEADGNYVRFTGKDMKPADIKELRKFFENSGAKGISIMAPRSTGASRRPGSAGTSATKTLDESVASFVDELKDLPAFINRNRLKADCADVLSVARSVSEEA